MDIDDVIYYDPSQMIVGYEPPTTRLSADSLYGLVVYSTPKFEPWIEVLLYSKIDSPIYTPDCFPNPILK